MRAFLVIGAIILAVCSIFGCASPELVVAGKVYQVSDAAACERLAAKTGGRCYARD